MQVKELLSRSIERDIKEVIKVDDRQSVLEEIEEYVPTDHITEELIETLEQYQETINSPSDEVNIWVSGFFGSGKSSFAKVLGYLLANPEIDGVRVAERFFELNDISRAQALLNTIHSQAPTETVLLDLNTSPNVLHEGEPIVLPVYRTLLREFGYSSDITLAELEFELEDPTAGLGVSLGEFEAKYHEVFDVGWDAQRHLATAKNRASRILHELDSKNFPAADSWSNVAEPPAITAKWFVQRCRDLLKRRRPDKKRLVLVVDEAGLYVSKSNERIRHLLGLAEECQKARGDVWVVATSQEKLTDVMDSIEGRQTELAKAQDRFPIKVDLLPSDIDEVTSKRVLEKNAAGATALRQLLDRDRNKFTTSVTLQSDRHAAFSDDDFVRLYPLVPYQLQVLIDSVSARRAQGGAPQTMGGSNRTLIRHAQQLINNPKVGLAELPAGSLVTLDRSYVLLEDVIPTAWRHEVDQVAAKHGDDSIEAKIMRVIALCTDVPGVPLNSRNIAVALHPTVSSDPIEAAVKDALAHLVDEDRVRESDDGYRLQSPEQKDWDKERRGIELKPGNASRLRKAIIKDALGSMTVTKGRTFRVELSVDREKMSEGDIALDVRDDNDIDGIRQTSRGEDGKHRIFWAFQTADDTWAALEDLHRSNEMIDRHDKPGQTDAQRALLVEERKRRDRATATAGQLLGRDITNGTTVFDGNTDDAPTGDLKASADRLITSLIPKIYPQLDLFAGTFRRNDVLQVLQADSLDGIPSQLGPDGLKLFKITARGRELVTDAGPIHTVVSHIGARKQYGEDQSGGQLERHFANPPYGATVEAVQAVLAAAMRAGLLEVVSQTNRITSATDARLEQVFGNLPKFRVASFVPPETDGRPTIEERGVVSEWLASITGERFGLDTHDLARAGQVAFSPLRQPCTEARSTLLGAGLPVPDVLALMEELLGRLASHDDKDVVIALHDHRANLESGRASVTSIASVIDEQMDSLRSAQRALRMAPDLQDDGVQALATELAELLGRARYVDDIARIKTLTTQIEDAVAAETDQLHADITSQVEAALEQLRNRYPNMGDDTFANETQPLRSLLDASELPLLRANLAAVAGTVIRVTDALDAISTSKEVRHVRIGDVWSAPITGPDDLESALARIREAVLAQLTEDTEVRLR